MRHKLADIQLLQGDCLQVLSTLPDNSAQLVVTSPPYWGLRDYGTAKWEGGDAECDHNPQHPDGGERRDRTLPLGRGGLYRDTCGKCGAIRVDSQLGLERTPEEYVAKMVQVFREVRRVLRADGTLWINIGDSYAGASVPNVTDSLNYLLKGCDVIFGDTVAIAMTAKSVEVAPRDQGTPQGIFASLFSMQRECVKDRDYDFSEVLDFLAIPRDRIPSTTFRTMPSDSATTDTVPQIVNCTEVIISNLDSNLESEFAVLSPSSTSAGKGNDTTLTIEESTKPSAESLVRWHSVWDTFSLAARNKGVPNINLVNQTVALRYGHLPLACLRSDFRVTFASEKQVTFTSISGSVVFTVSDVRHLMFSFADGSIVPYYSLYAQSIRRSNRNRAKQELGIPDRVKVALQEDGWICRQTIIWQKPNPMPESVTDRCTKSHEYLFMFTKSARYYFDNEAIKEQAVTCENRPAGVVRDRVFGYNSKQRLLGRSGNKERKSSLERGCPTDHVDGSVPWEGATRNKRDVWSIATEPFKQWVETCHWERVALDDVCDGMMHILSVNCPVHGHLDRLDGEHVGDTSSHNLGTDKRLSQEPLVSEISNCSCLDSSVLGGSSDFLRQESCPSAIDHNNESRKTGRVPETNLSYMPCVQTECRRQRTSELRECDEPVQNIALNNSYADEMSDDQMEQTLHHIVDKSLLPIPPECLCGFYHKLTEKANHFAVMPTKLVEPCVLAGSKPGDVVLDPFSGAGTVGLVAVRLNRAYIGIELNPIYLEMSRDRIREATDDL